jgi:hypothetical protein
MIVLIKSAGSLDSLFSYSSFMIVMADFQSALAAVSCFISSSFFASSS